MNKIENRIGPCVEKDNFYGRVNECNRAWMKLRDGNSLVLAAPRRVGKTSFSKKMMERAKQEGWVTLYMDLESLRTEKDFAALFVEELQKTSKFETVKEWMKNLADTIGQCKPTVSVGTVEVSLEWKCQEREIYTQLKKLIEEFSKTDVLIVMDELAIFLNYLQKDSENGWDKIHFFLNWLRSFRQTPGSKIRWIFCSSIGIENFLSMQRLSKTLNDVESFKLEALSPVESDGLLAALANAYGLVLDETLRQYILNRIGWCLPYYIQAIFSEIHTLYQIENYPNLDPEVVDRAYYNLLRKSYFNTWDERLREEYSPLERPMRAVLDHLAALPQGANREALRNALYTAYRDEEQTNEILSKVLPILENDGYLMRKREGKKYVFRSFLLRDFWNQRFNE